MPIVRKATDPEIAEMRAQMPESELGRLNLEIKELEQKLEELKKKRHRLLQRQSPTAFVEVPEGGDDIEYPVRSDYLKFAFGLLFAERESAIGRKSLVFGIRERNLAQACRANFGPMWREQKVPIRGRNVEQFVLGQLVDDLDSQLYGAFRYIIKQYELHRRNQDVLIRHKDYQLFVYVWSKINSDWDRFLRNADQHGWNIIKR